MIRFLKEFVYINKQKDPSTKKMWYQLSMILVFLTIIFKLFGSDTIAGRIDEWFLLAVIGLATKTSTAYVIGKKHTMEQNGHDK